MRAEDIALVSSICRTRAGLKVAPEKTYLIETRLAPVARRAGLETVADLMDAIRRREEPLIWAAVEAMAGGETAFFRDRLPFQQLAEDLVPRLARNRGRAPVRIWSAACATGQEVYSIAMIAEQLRAETPALRIEIAASDLSTQALERAQAGLYNQFEVQRGLPIRQLTRHFSKEDDNWRLSESIRQAVRWRRINLIAGLNTIGRFDVVFCRYVLGAMTEEAQRSVLADLAALLPADGCLVLGLNEAICGLEETFEPVISAAGLYRPKLQAVAAA